MTLLNYASIGNKNISPHMLNKNVVTFLLTLHTNTDILVLPNVPPLALIPKSSPTFQMQKDKKSKQLYFCDTLKFLFPVKSHLEQQSAVLSMLTAMQGQNTVSLFQELHHCLRC